MQVTVLAALVSVVFSSVFVGLFYFLGDINRKEQSSLNRIKLAASKALCGIRAVELACSIEVPLMRVDAHAVSNLIDAETQMTLIGGDAVRSACKDVTALITVVTHTNPDAKDVKAKGEAARDSVRHLVARQESGATRRTRVVTTLIVGYVIVMCILMGVLIQNFESTPIR